MISRRFKLIALTLPLAVSLYFSALSFSSAMGMLAAIEWKCTRGTVVEIQNKPLSAEIRYKFTVDGHGYTGNRFSFGGSPYSDKKLINKRYQAGGGIDVYHHPDHPENSVIEKGESGGSLLACLIAPVTFLLLLSYAAHIWEQKTADPHQTAPHSHSSLSSSGSSKP